jgi:alpha-ketoglutarate-dependent taurine dioxygenase
MKEKNSRRPFPRNFARQKKSLEPNEVVKMKPLYSGQSLPIVITPNVEGVDINEWVLQNKDVLNKKLLGVGGILFRGFATYTIEQFKTITSILSNDFLDYTYQSTPRSKVEDQVYTSTEYPADQKIQLHNEMSYTRQWPLKISFFGFQPSSKGGETPIADSRKVYNKINPVIREQMAKKRLMYVRNYSEDLDLPWQQVFQTENPKEVEQFCQAQGIGFQWLDQNRLKTWQVCQAVAKHPITHEKVWFNQLHLFHSSQLDSITRDVLLQSYQPDELPREVYYGDGSKIEAAVVADILEVYNTEEIAFPWEKGDILLLDNMLVAHGRNAYEGSRRVLVNMSEEYSETP